MGSPRLAGRPLALLVTDGGLGGLGGPPPVGSGFGKPGPRDMGCPTYPMVLLLAAGIASYVPARWVAADPAGAGTYPITHFMVTDA